MRIFCKLLEHTNTHTTKTQWHIVSFLFNSCNKLNSYQGFHSKIQKAHSTLKPIRTSSLTLGDCLQQYSLAKNGHNSECLKMFTLKITF